MDSSFYGCLFLIALAVLLVPFVLVIAQARKIKSLEVALQKLAARIDALPTDAAVRTAAATEPVIQAQPLVSPTPAAIPAAPLVRPEPAAPPPRKTTAPRRPKAAIDWEAFMGVKLFAWIGGFVLFLGVVFLVKYSFENNLITPAMRILLGAVVGLAVVAAGWLTARKNYSVPGQSLCATGVLVLYADVFGAHTFYNLLSLGAAFALMSVITVAAFLLAVSMNAQVIVVLGLVGGFCTPPLLTTAAHTLPIFSYIALLDIGIAAVALRKRWDYLFLLAALGTVFMEAIWVPYFSAAEMTAGFPVFLGCEALFLGFSWMRARLQPNEWWSTLAAAVVGFAAIAFAFLLLDYESLATRPGFFFGFTFLADVGLLALALSSRYSARIAAPAGSVVFLLLAVWTSEYLNHALLRWALGAYFIFALIHAGFSVWPSRTPAAASRFNPQLYIPLLALVLLLVCVGRRETAFAVWICVLLIDVLAVSLAAALRSTAAIVVALLLTVVTAALWILLGPSANESIVGMLTVIGGCGLFFSGGASFVASRFGLNIAARRNVPTLAAAMPFVLLLMLVAKLPIHEPTGVFAVAALMAIVLLALGIVARTSWIAAVALIFSWAVQCEWHSLHFTTAHAAVPLIWYVAFWLLFVAYPFFTAEEGALPWAISALAGALQFTLSYDAIAAAYPHLRNALLPAAFVLPYLFGVSYLINQRRILPASGDARLAWQGGAALLFVSLIFPIQFQREWITLGWAFEGLALIALFRSVPNHGLRLVGSALLAIAFVRLALNPAVLEYHHRAATRIWNWYLYAYGLTSVCLFVGARLAQARLDTLIARFLPGLLYSLGTILTFLLLNIEIADYFSVGPTLTFSFSGNFARDMTYSIAWALFAFALLLLGMKRNLPYVRYASLALLTVTLLKLFIHDLSNLSQLYRIGAFIGVAIILIVASFVYQRFLSPPIGETETPSA